MCRKLIGSALIRNVGNSEVTLQKEDTPHFLIFSLQYSLYLSNAAKFSLPPEVLNYIDLPFNLSEFFPDLFRPKRVFDWLWLCWNIKNYYVQGFLNLKSTSFQIKESRRNERITFVVALDNYFPDVLSKLPGVSILLHPQIHLNM